MHCCEVESHDYSQLPMFDPIAPALYFLISKVDVDKSNELNGQAGASGSDHQIGADFEARG